MLRYSFLILLSSICFAKPYVTCHFDGQLGNQLFEAANAIAYGLDHDYEPIFPSLRDANNGRLNRKYVFHRVNTDKISRKPKFKHYFEALNRQCYFVPIPTFEGENLCLHGFYQSEKYFSRYRKIIRQLFAPTEEICVEIFKKYGDFLVKPCVALHIRTFIHDGANPNKDGFDWDYFMKAMDQFPPDHLFLVFSDSPEWVKENMPTSHRTMIFVEGNPHYFDFYAMSLCRHQIVSPSSTFSWWAAWLNNNPNKIVVAPSVWMGFPDSDAIPAGWIRI